MTTDEERHFKRGVQWYRAAAQRFRHAKSVFNSWGIATNVAESHWLRTPSLPSKLPREANPKLDAFLKGVEAARKLIS